MVAMRMMQAAVNQIVNVITMRHGRVTAFRAVNVLGRMFGGGITGRAFVGIRRAHINPVFIHMVAVRMVQMPVVKIIHVPVMLDRNMSAVCAVNMGMVAVSCAGMLFAHNRFV